MLTIEKSILLHRDLLLRLVLVTPRSPFDFVFGKDTIVDGHSDVDRATRFIE